MKYLFLILPFLFAHALLFGQDDWGQDIKKTFREENYEEVIRLCKADSVSYSKEHKSTDHDYERNLISQEARNCLQLIDMAQKINAPNKAKALLEKVIKMREEIWHLVGENEPISHPFTTPLIAEIGRRPINPPHGTLRDNKKELSRIEKKQEQSSAKQDSILSMQQKIEKEMAEMKSFLSEAMVQKDSAYQALEKEKERLGGEFRALKDTLTDANERIEKLKATIQLQEKGNFLPLGIKQFRNDRKALGYTFLLSEIAIPVALGIGLESAADWNYDRYKNQEAQTLREHKDYYKKYKDYHRAAIWAPIVTGVLVYGANVLCNYYCPIKESNIALHPALEVDYRGKVLCGVGMSFNF